LEFCRDSPPIWAEPLLVCSAPVSRPFILDLKRRRSVIGHLLAAGFQTYLVDWGVATAADGRRGLFDHSCGIMGKLVDFLRERSRMPHVHLMGYCLGGTLAAIFTALSPSRVKNLILLGAPIDFAADRSLTKLWTDSEYFDVDALIDSFRCCPGLLLRSCLTMMKPVRNFYGKLAEFAAGIHDQECLESWLALEEWAAARVSVAGALFRDVVKLLYQQDLLARGLLELAGTRVRLDRISCPVLLMTATEDHLVSPESTLGLVPRICSREVSIMSMEGGHESLVASAKAHRSFWPEAAQWITDHSTPRTGPWIRPGEAAIGPWELRGSEAEGRSQKSSP
jgi:polyhydroxyalkanoate synthase